MLAINSVRAKPKLYLSHKGLTFFVTRRRGLGPISPSLLNKLISAVAIVLIGFEGLWKCYAMTCEDVFETPHKSKVSDYTTSFKEDETLAAKIKIARAQNPLWADTPMTELRPFIDRMQAELRKADRRMILARTPWAVRKAIMIRVRYLEWSIAAARILPTYRATMDLAFRFAATISVIEMARGHNEYQESGLLNSVLTTLLNRTALRATRLKQALWISQKTGAVVLPTFAVLTQADMNRFWSRNILVLGFAGHTVRYDAIRGAFRYTNHDMGHILQYVSRHLKMTFDSFDFVGNGISSNKGFRDSLQKFKLDLLTSEKVEVAILSELDRHELDEMLPHGFLKTRRVTVEWALFDLRHEGGALPVAEPSQLLSEYHWHISQELKAPNESLRALHRERAEAFMWLAERYRAHGVAVPMFSREDAITELQRTNASATGAGSKGDD